MSKCFPKKKKKHQCDEIEKVDVRDGRIPLKMELSEKTVLCAENQMLRRIKCRGSRK